ncbi:DUF4427 domain-containing protein [Pseudomonas sp. Irchel 3F6]|uniref:DUF4427 domain-containing protein n=1 Tax=Pseudomonas sp. Irchel 3F6 TaxID=2009003 RepID=UPI000BA4AD64|nr:DUF4427 domain-containing protein [Pseudomonas sp. Irchel 3F6]
MAQRTDVEQPNRVVHYFRDVDLTSGSRPDFIPESFALNCWAEDCWPRRFLLRVAIRFHHIWATFGVRNGHATIQGRHPAVCFSGFSVSDLVAVRDGLAAASGAVTQYAITFPTHSAEQAGATKVVRGENLRAMLQASHPSEPVTQEEIWRNQYRYLDGQLDIFGNQTAELEWRWPYTLNYRRAIEKIEREGHLGDKLPGIDLAQKKWSQIGVVVATEADALRLQYDILCLIDQQVVSVDHFDHLLVCERLPKELDGLTATEQEASMTAACLDFKSGVTVSDEDAAVAAADFKARISALETSSLKGEIQERGGCWVYFEDNSHPYVRALLKAGLVVVNKSGRYLGTLTELGRGRDLEERQLIVKTLCKQLEQEHGVPCSYFSVRDSWLSGDLPSYCGHPGRGFYRITDEPDEEDTDV